MIHDECNGDDAHNNDGHDGGLTGPTGLKKPHTNSLLTTASNLQWPATQLAMTSNLLAMPSTYFLCNYGSVFPCQNACHSFLKNALFVSVSIVKTHAQGQRQRPCLAAARVQIPRL